jgi:hypothetical protein
MSTPTLLGTLVGVGAVVIGIFTGAWIVAWVVFMVAAVGWVTLALRDLIQRRRAT